MWGKPLVEEVEKEFKTNELKNKRVFHDLNIRVNDPEELRMSIIETLTSMNYDVSLNELTEFEDVEFDKFFKAGRLKPVKVIIKSVKRERKGSRFPVLWKALILLGVLALVGYFLPVSELNKELLFYTTIALLVLGTLLFMIKEIIKSGLWVKAVGIYDVESVKADVRLVIAADIDKGEDELEKLKEDASAFYEVISRKFIKAKPTEQLIKPTKTDKTAEVMATLVQVNKSIDDLNQRFAQGRISEDTYKSALDSLNKRKSKLETIFDLVSV